MGNYTKTTANGKQACRELWESILDTKGHVNTLKTTVGIAAATVILGLLLYGAGVAVAVILAGAGVIGVPDVSTFKSAYQDAKSCYEKSKINFMLVSSYAWFMGADV